METSRIVRREKICVSLVKNEDGKKVVQKTLVENLSVRRIA